jgi:hypothetical protein
VSAGEYELVTVKNRILCRHISANVLPYLGIGS